jgi:hypothetical protein
MAKRAKKKAAPSIPATQNEGWGFWGTMSANLVSTVGISRQEAVGMAWQSAIETLVAELGISPETARGVLDSRLGRHLADQIPSFAATGETIERLMRTKGWRRDAVKVAMEYGPVATPALPKGQSKAAFARYLRGTLIPDLRESGRDATADDFETCLRFMGEG